MNKTSKEVRLRELKKQIVPDLQLKLGALQKQMSQLQRDIHKYETEAVDLTIELTPKTPTDPKVSDHALIRYLERHHKFDLDKFRNEILTSTCIDAIRSGCKTVKCNGLSFRVENNVIVTVI